MHGAINSAIPFSLFALAAQFLTAGMSSVRNSDRIPAAIVVANEQAEQVLR